MLLLLSPLFFLGQSYGSSVRAMFRQSLFLVWIRSEVTTHDMWSEFREKLSQLVEWKAVVTQWEEKVIQLTLILIEHLYPKPEVKNKRGRNSSTKKQEEGKGEGESESSLRKEEKKTDVVPDQSVGLFSSSDQVATRGITSKPRDVHLTSMAWNQQKIMDMWDIILRIASLQLPPSPLQISHTHAHTHRHSGQPV